VELDVRQVKREARGRADGRERRLDIARDPQVAAMDVERMRHAEIVDRTGQRGQDRARRQAVMRPRLVEVEASLVVLEGVDAARVDRLDGEALRRRQHPADIVADGARPLAARQQLQQQVVAAEHEVAAGVDDGDVRHLEMGVPSVRAEHGGLEGGRVAHLGIAAAGHMGRGRDDAAAAPAEPVRRHHAAVMLLGHQEARQVDLAAGDVAVDVDRARHDDHAGEVVLGVDAVAGSRGRHDAPVADVDLCDRAVAAVRGVVYPRALEAGQHGIPRRSRISAILLRTQATLGSPRETSPPARNATTPSPRNTWPG
jgi:hypothetical protein